MRLSILAAFVVVAAVPVQGADAQRDDQFVWGIGAGATIPSGLASDNHKVGPHASLMFGIGGVDAPVGVRLEGMYTLLGDADGSGAIFDQGKARVFNLMGDVVLSLYGSNRKLYALGGVGGFWFNPDGPNTNAVNDFAVNAGLGVWFPGINGFVEARWLNMFHALPDPVTGLKGKKSARVFPLTLGIMF